MLCLILFSFKLISYTSAAYLLDITYTDIFISFAFFTFPFLTLSTIPSFFFP